MQRLAMALLLALIALTSLGPSLVVAGVDYVFTGTGNVNWIDAINWQGGIVPTVFNTGSTVWLNTSGGIIEMPTISLTVKEMVTGDVTLNTPAPSSVFSLLVNSLTASGSITTGTTLQGKVSTAYTGVTSGTINVAAGSLLTVANQKIAGQVTTLNWNVGTGGKIITNSALLSGSQTFTIGDGATVTLGGTYAGIATMIDNDITFSTTGSGTGKVLITGEGVQKTSSSNPSVLFNVDVDVYGNWKQSDSVSGSMGVRNGKTLKFIGGSLIDSYQLSGGSTTGSGTTGFIRFVDGTTTIRKSSTTYATTSLDVYNRGQYSIDSSATLLMDTATTWGDFSGNSNATIAGNMIANGNLIMSPATYFTSGSKFSVNGAGVTARFTKATFTGSTVSSSNGGAFSIITQSGVTFADGTSLNGTTYLSTTTGGCQITGTVTIDGSSNFTHSSMSSNSHVVVNAASSLLVNAPMNIQTGVNVANGGAIKAQGTNGAINVFYDQTTSGTARLDLTGGSSFGATGSGVINVGTAGKGNGAINMGALTTTGYTINWTGGSVVLGSKGSIVLSTGGMTVCSTDGSITGVGSITADAELWAVGTGARIVLANTGTNLFTANGGIGSAGVGASFVVASGATATHRSAYVSTNQNADAYLQIHGTLEFITGGTGPSWYEANTRIASGGTVAVRLGSTILVTESSTIRPADGGDGAGSVYIAGTITTSINKKLTIAGVPVTIAGAGMLNPQKGGIIAFTSWYNTSSNTSVAGSVVCTSCEFQASSSPNSTIQIGESGDTAITTFTVNGAAMILYTGNITVTSGGQFVVSSGSSLSLSNNNAYFTGAGEMNIAGTFATQYSSSRVYFAGANINLLATGNIDLYAGSKIYISGETYISGGNVSLDSTSTDITVTPTGFLQFDSVTTSFVRGGRWTVNDGGTAFVMMNTAFATQLRSTSTSMEWNGGLTIGAAGHLRVEKGVTVTGTATINVMGGMEWMYGALVSGTSVTFGSSSKFILRGSSTGTGFTTGATFTGACNFDGELSLYLNGYTPTSRVPLITCGAAITKKFSSVILYRTSSITSKGRRLLGLMGTITYEGKVLYYDPDAEIASSAHSTITASSSMITIAIATIIGMITMMTRW